jgi:hypothetical protein
MIHTTAIIIAVLSIITNVFQYFWNRQTNQMLEELEYRHSGLIDTYIEIRGKFFDMKNRVTKKPINRTPPQKKRGPGRPLGSKNK